MDRHLPATVPRVKSPEVKRQQGCLIRPLFRRFSQSYSCHHAVATASRKGRKRRDSRSPGDGHAILPPRQRFHLRRARGHGLAAHRHPRHRTAHRQAAALAPLRRLLPRARRRRLLCRGGGATLAAARRRPPRPRAHPARGAVGGGGQSSLRRGRRHRARPPAVAGAAGLPHHGELGALPPAGAAALPAADRLRRDARGAGDQPGQPPPGADRPRCRACYRDLPRRHRIDRRLAARPRRRSGLEAFRRAPGAGKAGPAWCRSSSKGRTAASSSGRAGSP